MRLGPSRGEMMAACYGTQSKDVLEGTDLDDIIYGWAKGGDPASDLGDVLRGLAGDGSLFGGGGRDRLIGGDGRDKLDGGDDNDWLSGGSGNDWLIGGDGDDLLEGQEGSDMLNGGSGSDTADYSESQVGVEIFLSTGNGFGSHGNDEGDTLISIENVNGSKFRDTMFGNDNANHFQGFAGRDWLDGGDGNDTLDGGDGDDYLVSGDGHNTLDGGRGQDRFLIGSSLESSYTDTITDFGNDIDTIELDASLGVRSVEGALSHAEVVAGDTVFTFDTGDVLIVENIANPNQLRNDIDIA
jgi:Ca2+-binding RTX toxin-like protein